MPGYRGLESVRGRGTHRPHAGRRPTELDDVAQRTSVNRLAETGEAIPAGSAAADGIEAQAALRAIRALIGEEIIVEKAAERAVAAMVTAEPIEEEATEEALAAVLAAEEIEAEAEVTLD